MLNSWSIQRFDCRKLVVWISRVAWTKRINASVSRNRHFILRKNPCVTLSHVNTCKKHKGANHLISRYYSCFFYTKWEFSVLLCWHWGALSFHSAFCLLFLHFGCSLAHQCCFIFPLAHVSLVKRELSWRCLDNVRRHGPTHPALPWWIGFPLHLHACKSAEFNSWMTENIYSKGVLSLFTAQNIAADLFLFLFLYIYSNRLSEYPRYKLCRLQQVTAGSDENMVGIVSKIKVL